MADLKPEIDEFIRKSDILSVFGEEVSPESFYDDLFAGNTDIELPVTILSPGSNERHVKKTTLSEALLLSKGRNDVLIGSCSYFHSYISSKTMKDIYGFIIDMDSVSSSTLRKLLSDGWVDTNGRPVPLPTYIVNSGHGLHLVFILSEVIPAYASSRKNLIKLYQNLLILECYYRDVDFAMQWIGQNFRMVGGLNKLGLVNTAYKVGDYWDIDDLGVKLGIKEHFRRYGEVPKDSLKQFTKKPRTIYAVNKGVYDYALRRCHEETEVGTRYYSFLGIVSLAVKTNVSYRQLEEDLEELRQHYNSKSDNKMAASEIQHALRNYNKPISRFAKAETLSKWFGWEWDYKNKDVKRRTGSEHYPRKKTEEMREKGELTSMEVYAQAKRDELYPDRSWAGHRKSKENVVSEWQQAHPGGKKSDCIRDTGLNKRTVYKWWKDEK